MEINLKISDLVEIITEDVSRLAARSYAEDGSSLFDGIKLTSRDTGVLGRMLEERDAKLRDMLAFCLGEPTTDTKSNSEGEEEEEEEESLVYVLLLGDGVKSSTRSSLKVLVRKYLTEGVLYDWYTKHNIPTTLTLEGIEEMETKIVCMVRQGYIRRPLQPFGPRN